LKKNNKDDSPLGEEENKVLDYLIKNPLTRREKTDELFTQIARETGLSSDKIEEKMR